MFVILEHLPYVNIWEAMSASGLSTIHIMPQGETEYYVEDILVKEFKPLLKRPKRANEATTNKIVVNESQINFQTFALNCGETLPLMSGTNNLAKIKIIQIFTIFVRSAPVNIPSKIKFSNYCLKLWRNWIFEGTSIGADLTKMVKICFISICAKKIFFVKIIGSTYQRKCFSTILRQ